jgi:peptide/nickel transport system permease protein
MYNSESLSVDVTTSQGDRHVPRLALPAWLRQRQPSFTAGVITLALVAGATFAVPLVYHVSTIALDPLHQLSAPSRVHPLGTDQLGRDQLARVLVGGQASLVIGFAASVIAVLLGVAYGLAAGLGARPIDALLMRLLDTLLAVPTVVILLFLAALATLNNAILIVLLGLTSWPRTARVVRNETLNTRGRDFVTASRQFGGGTLWIARAHILRTILPILVVNLVFLAADNVLALSFLSFLGLGVQPPTPSWGNLLYDGMQSIFSNAWWMIYPAGLMIFLTVVAVNMIGEGVVAAMEQS